MPKMAKKIRITKTEKKIKERQQALMIQFHKDITKSQGELGDLRKKKENLKQIIQDEYKAHEADLVRQRQVNEKYLSILQAREAVLKQQEEVLKRDQELTRLNFVSQQDEITSELNKVKQLQKTLDGKMAEVDDLKNLCRKQSEELTAGLNRFTRQQSLYMKESEDFDKEKEGLKADQEQFRVEQAVLDADKQKLSKDKEIYHSNFEKYLLELKGYLQLRSAFTDEIKKYLKNEDGLRKAQRQILFQKNSLSNLKSKLQEQEKVLKQKEKLDRQITNKLKNWTHYRRGAK